MGILYSEDGNNTSPTKVATTAKTPWVPISQTDPGYMQPVINGVIQLPILAPYSQQKPSSSSGIRITDVGGELIAPVKADLVNAGVPAGSQVTTSVDEVKVTTPTGDVTVYKPPTEAQTTQVKADILSFEDKAAKLNQDIDAFNKNPVSETEQKELEARQIQLTQEANQLKMDIAVHNVGNAGITLSSTSYEMPEKVKAPKGLAQSLWWGYTPWQEETGESVKSYVKKVGYLRAAGAISDNTLKAVAPAVALTALTVLAPPLGIAASAALGGYMAYQTQQTWRYMSKAEKGFSVGMTMLCFLPAIVHVGGKVGVSVKSVVGSKEAKLDIKATKAVIKTAKAVDKAQINLAKARELFEAKLRGETLTKDIGKLTQTSNMQKAAQAAKVADTKFVDALRNVVKISEKDLAKVEKLSGVKGLRDKIVELGRADTKLKKAWNQLDQFELGTNGYTKQLTTIDKVRAAYQKSLDALNSKVETIYRSENPMPRKTAGLRGQKGFLGQETVKQLAIDPRTGKTVTLDTGRLVPRKMGAQTITKERPVIQKWPTLPEETGRGPVRMPQKSLDKLWEDAFGPTAETIAKYNKEVYKAPSKMKLTTEQLADEALFTKPIKISKPVKTAFKMGMTQVLNVGTAATLARITQMTSKMTSVQAAKIMSSNKNNAQTITNAVSRIWASTNSESLTNAITDAQNQISEETANLSQTLPETITEAATETETQAQQALKQATETALRMRLGEPFRDIMRKRITIKIPKPFIPIDTVTIGGQKINKKDLKGAKAFQQGALTIAGVKQPVIYVYLKGKIEPLINVGPVKGVHVEKGEGAPQRTLTSFGKGLERPRTTDIGAFHVIVPEGRYGKLIYNVDKANRKRRHIKPVFKGKSSPSISRVRR